MDKKKTSASASGKHGEKKEGNFLTKTAQSIRDKVQGLTDEVKEKTQNLKHGGESKKAKKNKDSANAGANSRLTAQGMNTSNRDDSDDSDTETDSPKPAQPTSRTSATAVRKSSGPTNQTVLHFTDKTSDARKGSGGFTSNNPSSKPSNTNDKEVPSRSSTKVQSKPSVAQSKDTTDTEKPSTQPANKDHIHIDFYGISTVDELLNRIDSAVEKAKIVIEQGAEPVPVRINTKPNNAPMPSVADLEKRSVDKNTTDKTKTNSEDQNDEPIRIDYNQIQKLEDILLKVDNQPGYRKVVLENVPRTPEPNDVQKQDNPFFGPTHSLTVTKSNERDQTSNSTTTNDTDDAPPKSILKTSQDPSSLDTLTKIASFQDDQIHVNIETVQSVDGQSDESSEKTFSPIETPSQEEPQQQQDTTPQAKDAISVKKQLAPSVSLPNKKREAPKAPQPAKAQDDSNANILPIAVSQFNNFSLVSTTKSAEKLVSNENIATEKSSPKESTNNETTDWI